MRECLSVRRCELQFLFCLFPSLTDSPARARRGLPTLFRDPPDRASKRLSSIKNKVLDKLYGAKRRRSGGVALCRRRTSLGGMKQVRAKSMYRD